ncbi:hypothetical protein NHX12_024284 [Muraenolepis orangiensis]|uniref:Uncharacterized protein n=1 Tax=Muraenolepis orangiensis TaxID=630683 RepID=A0A9Q0ISX3_9TELE|nr:hypothetical protein NHX12_024284 [Muraenolepis orangiensis]
MCFSRHVRNTRTTRPGEVVSILHLQDQRVQRLCPLLWKPHHRALGGDGRRLRQRHRVCAMQTGPVGVGPLIENSDSDGHGVYWGFHVPSGVLRCG